MIRILKLWKFFRTIQLVFFLAIPNAFAAVPYQGRFCGNNNDQIFCMVCNTYFETRGEPFANKVNVARTVLTRVKSGDYEDTACQVIHAPSQFSWTFSRNKTLPGPRSKKVDLLALAESVRAVEQARRLGPNGYTHFYNPKKASPAWARSRACGGGRGKGLVVGHHKFMACTADIDQILQSSAQLASIDPNILPLIHATSGSFDFEGGDEASPGERTIASPQAPAALHRVDIDPAGNSISGG